MKFIRFCLFFILFSFVYLVPIQAAPELRAQFSPEAPKVSDEISLDLMISWPKAEANYNFSTPDYFFNNLKLVRQGESQSTTVQGDNEIVQKTYSLVLKPERPGMAEIHEFTIPYIDPDSQKGGTLSFKGEKIKIHDVFNPLPVIIIAAAVVLVAVGILMGVRFFKKRTVLTTTDEVNSSQAEERFNAILKLDTNNRAKVLRELVSAIGTVLANQYGLHERLNDEENLLRAAEKLEVNREEKKKMERLFSSALEARYSGESYPEHDYQSLIKDLTTFVRERKMYLSH